MDQKSAPECPVECGGGVQSLFGQCPNVGGVKRIGSSLRTICTVRYSTFLGGLAFKSPEKKIDANCCIHVVVWNRWITETTGIIFWSRVGFARSNVWLTGHPVNKHEFRDVCQKKRENVGILKKKNCFFFFTQIHFFCNLTKWFLACQIHSEVLKHALQ